MTFFSFIAQAFIKSVPVPWAKQWKVSIPCFSMLCWATSCEHQLAMAKFLRSWVLKAGSPWTSNASQSPSGGYLNTPYSIRRPGCWVNICRWFVPFNSVTGLLSWPLISQPVVDAFILSFTGLGPCWLEESSFVLLGQPGDRDIIYSLFSLWWRQKGNSLYFCWSVKCNGTVGIVMGNIFLQRLFFLTSQFSVQT